MTSTPEPLSRHSSSSKLPTPPQPPNPTTAEKVGDQGKKYICIQPSPGTMPLKASETPTESPKDRAAKELEHAHKLIEENQYEEAKSLLENLILFFKEDESSLLQLAHCHIGLALTEPKNPRESEKYLVQAKAILDAILAKTWNSYLPKGTKIQNCLAIKSLYVKIRDNLSSDQIDLNEDLGSKIDECSQQIPVLYDFYAQLDKAKDLLKEKRASDKVRKLVENALPILTEDSPAFSLAKADGYILIAETFPKGNERNENSTRAMNFALSAYEQKKALFQQDTEIDVYRSFQEVFGKLKKLLPENNTILKTYEECRQLHATHKKNSKITKHPVGNSWKPSRVFALLALAAVVIFSVVVLSRRFITKLN
jgi:hypothetical protein